MKSVANGQVFQSLREAIHHTFTRSKVPMKALAAEMDWSPSQLSMATTLGEENARPFPADDEHLIKGQKLTGDYSILLTMADLLGCEVRLKQDSTPELLAEVKQEIRLLMPKIQMILEIGNNADAGKDKRPKRQ